MTQRSAASLLPREHGAYAQLGTGLAAALALAPGLRSLGQGVLTAALFLASEPALVLLGRRGQVPGGPGRARLRLGVLGALGILGALAAWSGAPAALFRTLVPAALLGLVLFGLFLARRERTAAGEVLAAWTFGAAAPLALILAALFSLGTAVVHGHLMALRRASPVPRGAAFLLGAALCAAAWALGGRLLPRGAWLALLPMTLAALAIRLFPPAPRRLKAVGWAAAACALAGGALAVACLR